MRERNQDTTELAEAFKKFLNCRCEYYPPMANDSQIMKAYQEAKERGEKEGFTPVIVTVDDILWECISMNTEAGEGSFDFDPEAVARYREKIMNTPIGDGKEIFEKRLESLEEYLQEQEDWDEFAWEEMEDEMEDDEVPDHFIGYSDYRTGSTTALILAEIPVKNPWEIFAYLPFGGWNECPDTMELMAAAKYWYELYHAVPAVITHDTLEFSLPAPVEEDASHKLASEQYVFCPDIVDQASEGFSVGLLAKTLEKSNIWYFWWD